MSVDVDGSVLLYDGSCALCSGLVRFVLRRDRRRSLRFASLQGDWASHLVAAHPELVGVDSAVWFDPHANETNLRSDAILRLMSYLGGPWRLAAAARIVPRPVRDAVYDFIARHRHRAGAPAEECFVPPPDGRARFLD